MVQESVYDLEGQTVTAIKNVGHSLQTTYRTAYHNHMLRLANIIIVV